MKNLEIVIISLLTFLGIYLHMTPNIDNLKDFKNHIVMDKKTYPVIGNIMILKSQLGDFKGVRCYDVVFIKYNIGDTIKVKL